MDCAAPEPSLSVVPWMLGHSTSATTTSHATEMILCNTCISTCADLQSLSSKQPLSRGPPFLKSPEGHSLTLNYETEDEDRIVKEIVAMGIARVKDRPPLTAAFLLCMCIQYSSACLHTSDLRRLLLLIASGVQSAMWVSCGKTDVRIPATMVGGLFTIFKAALISIFVLTMDQVTVLSESLIVTNPQRIIT